MIKSQTTAKYETKEVFTFNLPLLKKEESYNLFIVGKEIMEIGKILSFEFFQPPKSLWGLLKGLKIEEKDIEKVKKSLFPERDF